MSIIGFDSLSELRSIMRTVMLCCSYYYCQCGDECLPSKTGKTFSLPN